MTSLYVVSEGDNPTTLDAYFASLDSANRVVRRLTAAGKDARIQELDVRNETTHFLIKVLLDAPAEDVRKVAEWELRRRIA